ncbi:TadB Flp pilus assembly protein TadB [Candidatus Nanopelagicaceae bacterium]
MKRTSTKGASIKRTSTQRTTIKTAARSVSLSPKWRQITISAVSGLGVGFAITFLSSSIPIASAFALMATAITFIFLATKAKRDETKFELLWPDVVDHLITGIQSGMSLVEALSQLAERGPRELAPYFAEFNRQIRKDGDFNSAVSWLQNQFSHYASDQIFEALILSRSLGGTHLLQILRMVGDFIRQDLALRKEIEVKHGWIKNSAHLSAAAPWLLLLLLSTQPATVTAYSTATGAVILVSGIFMTAVAYFWMNKLGALPKPPRVFGSKSQNISRVFGSDNQRSPRLFGSKSQNIIASRQVSTR